jgi:sporulation protein YlmC with PRC-barrel domain
MGNTRIHAQGDSLSFFGGILQLFIGTTLRTLSIRDGRPGRFNIHFFKTRPLTKGVIMQFNQDAKVYSSNGEDLGRLDRIVLDPASGSATHIVVRKGWFFTEDRVVPVDLVASAGGDEIRLKTEVSEPEEFPLFEESHYLRADSEDVEHTGREEYVMPSPLYWYPPASVSIGFPAYYPMSYTVETGRNIPEGSVALKEDAAVITSDGEKVGEVERLVTAEGGQVTHLLVSSGLLKPTTKLIPSNWIASVSDEDIELGVSSSFIESLPDYKD